MSASATRVLIIEDNRDARTTMRMLLSMGHGHVVHEAEDGESGVRSALELRPDVALVDVGLPDMNGHEVARRIRAELDAGSITLIAITGYGSEEDRQLARDAGFDAHLVKPVDSAALLRILEGVGRGGALEA